MTEESRLIFRGNKCADIIINLSVMYGISPEKATDIFYKSETASLIEDRVADLHCRSSKYLASLIWDEFNGK